MFGKTTEEPYETKIKILKEKLDNCDAILIGGAAGMSAAGFRRYYERTKGTKAFLRRLFLRKLF